MASERFRANHRLLGSYQAGSLPSSRPFALSPEFDLIGT
jgi:hypothetical protein